MLTACASSPDGRFPSLAKRPYEESTPQSSTHLIGQPADILTPALAGKQSALESRIIKADAVFQSDLPAMQAIARSASGSARSSERWVNAHAQLSRLERTRADAVAALAQLDEMTVKQLDEDSKGNGPLYAPLLKNKWDALSKLIKAQNKQIDMMARQIGY